MSISTLLEKAQSRIAKATDRGAMAPMPESAGHRLIEAEVVAVGSPAASVRRITLHAEGFVGLGFAGADEYFGLLMPGPSGRLVLPDPDRLNIRAAVAEIPQEDRPVLRWYTVRRHDPVTGTLDVDIVTHGTAGPGSAWALSAAAGDRVGFRQCGALFLPGDASRLCFVVDETAAPGLCAILESRDLDPDCRLIVEASDPAHLTPLPWHPGLTVVSRDGAAPGERALALLRELDAEAFDYFYLCGESDLASSCRRYLVSERGVDRHTVLFSGYWKLGQARV
ncbi:siderophore-interacting protein [Tessaracoccus sp. MC1627]|uniref:siderophore-interacting protein n=1 Tax=Tessaracoccus sp. MC1627 TaxID=2760312 RepID=UPI0016046F20|nr:siderophore-interacting protein [Tessaracoccus sp. MC1627]